MQTTLALTGLFMGLAGGPHCVAMCGAACAGLTKAGEAAAGPRNLPLGLFQVGRVLGYGLLGGLAGGSLQGLGWLTIHSAALRPVWAFFHVAALAVGLVMLLSARQPLWLERGARALWTQVRGWTTRAGGWAPLGLGMAWALLPCGLLYSALLVASLAGSAVSGAGVMVLFALGTAVSMVAGPWLWLRLQGRHGDWGLRIAGAALALSSAWALWMGLAHDAAPWCVAPA
jgi:uncharacterized protein